VKGVGRSGNRFAALDNLQVAPNLFHHPVEMADVIQSRSSSLEVTERPTSSL
jgi:hypothetical protein